MIINKGKKISLIVFLILGLSISNRMYAQTFRWEASMADSVTREGFYNIVVNPEIGSKLRSDYSDIRILDSEGYEVSYVQKSEEPYFVTEQFKEYPIVSKQIVDKCCTKLVIKNPGKKPINNICLILKNSDAIKVYRMAGSDDGLNWYGVKKYDVFYTTYSATDTKVVNYINFPLTDYLYYRFDIVDRGYWDEDRWTYWYSDRWSYPVNILQVGNYETYLKEGKYQSVPTPKFEQADSNKLKQTYIKVTFDNNYLVNRIRFDFKGPLYYRRLATVVKKIEDKKGRVLSYEPITTLELNSYSLNEFDLTYFREKEIYLVIDNDDNHSLKLDSIHTWQLTRYLKAYLEKGKEYRLVYGDSTATEPVYDLRYFVDSIPQVLPTLPVSKIEAKSLEIKEIKSEKGKEKPLRWFENKLFIWMAIGTVISFLFWKMLNEMKKNKGRE